MINTPFNMKLNNEISITKERVSVKSFLCILSKKIKNIKKTLGILK